MHLRNIIAGTGAVLEGEYFFALKKKGNISTKYINIDPVFTHPEILWKIAGRLIAPWSDEAVAFAAPATGGIPLLYAAAKASLVPARIAWADKQADGTFAFERMGFVEAIRGKPTVVLEDVTSSGESMRAVCELVEQSGGDLIGASCIWNRGSVPVEVSGAPRFLSLISESVETWKAEEHSMWGKWPLVADVGHPEYFPTYPGPRINLLK